ncbi:unnamed protein product [Adineta steineri]|uniref:Protein tweety homolog n=1 Tax=Adineta steineri TaxID=433720 RepID=A0A815MXX4_9BILA|nr:unnamed protein product [Adineta steineri]CAF1624240.1 unnamed protein product [Adineta steineri]
MAINLTCLDTYPSSPLVPILANNSNASIHPSSYNPGTGGLAQIISTSIINSAFSIDDVRTTLKTIFDTDSQPWSNISEITKIKPIPSIIIYTSIILGLIFSLSLNFCVFSCLKSRKQRGRKREQSKTTQICTCLVIILYLVALGDMIYVAYRVNKSNGSIDTTIKQVNRDIYPKEIRDYFIYVRQQIENLDEYCAQPATILINASKSILVETFDKILKEKYFIRNITDSLNNITTNIKDLDIIVADYTSISPSANETYEKAKKGYNDMMNSLQTPLQEICNYASQSQPDIDNILLNALNLVHEYLRKVITTIDYDILEKILPSDNQLFMSIEFEEEIRGYISSIGTVFLILIIFVVLIPVGFLIFLILAHLCRCDRTESSNKTPHDLRMRRISDVSSMNGSHRHKSHHGYSQQDSYSQDEDFEYTNRNSSCVVPCLMRLAYSIMVIIFIIMVIFSGVYYALDLSIQGACRSVHDDQPFLVSFVTDKIGGTHTSFFNGSDINTTVLNVIDDCHNNVHFTIRMIDNYWSTLDRYINDMMNELNKNIFEEFIKSIGETSIPDEITLLNQFISEANIPNIATKVNQIKGNLTTIQTILKNITVAEPTLPQTLVNSTIMEFNDYVKKVFELTLDSCPLPLPLIYKTDTLICHELGGSISGLWLSIFFLMFLTVAGLCVFGIKVYKRLN